MGSQIWNRGATARSRIAIIEKATSPMDIKQAKAAKSNLDNEITELLKKFSADTGFVVEHVSIEQLFAMGASTDYVVTTDVGLP